MLASLITLRSLAPSVPAVVLLGSGPCYFWLWACIRAATLPLPKRWYHQLEQFLCWGPYQRLCMFFMEGLSGVEFKVYGDVPKKKDPVNGLLIANHQCVSDWIIIDSFAMRLGNAGYIHFFAKNALKYAPLFGVYWHQHGLIFVKRDRCILHETLCSIYSDHGDNNIDFIRKQLRAKKKNNIPMLMTLFPEGTRFNPDNKQALEKSHAYARSIMFPECTKVLTPRITGANIFIEELGDHLKTIFDITIAYESVGGEVIRPDTLEFLDNVKAVHIHVKQRSVKSAAEDEGWLHDSFKEKENMLVQFDKTLTFPDPANFNHIYTWSVFSETVIPVLYTAAICSPLIFSKRARSLWLQTVLIVPILQLLAKPFWK